MPSTVLIVEDADACSTTLEIALTALPGVQVVTAASGRAAWQRVQQRDIAAIVTDLQMPHMDGFELIERVRGDAGLAHVPIIVVSGDSDPDTPERVRRLGANAYFVKPYSPAAVREKLERLLNAHPSQGSP